MTDDLALFNRWCDGDNLAGQQLLRRHFDSIYAFFETKCENEADELTQATFLACLKSKDRFRKQSSFRTYLFQIARHELYHLFRRRQRHDQKLDFDVSSIAELVSTPGTRIGRRQEHAHLIESLRRLPVDQQTLLELHYWEELDIAELAEVFDIEPGAIRTRLTRARKALQAELEKGGAPKTLDTLESVDVWVRQAKPIPKS